MIFKETILKGAFVIDIEAIEDRRGFFARSWCKLEFEAAGLLSDFVQHNMGYSIREGTVRGLHYQIEPYQEVKVVRCTRGAIYDVIVDLQPDSATYKKWFGIELSALNHKMLYVPKGFAHGYQTLSDDSEIHYLTSEIYHADFAKGHRYDDPAFGIQWPIEISLISDQDLSWPRYVL